MLDDHVKIVNHEELTEMARQKFAAEGKNLTKNLPKNSSKKFVKKNS